MGLFGNKLEKIFQSNNKLIEIIEKEVEKRYLYRNVESIAFAGSNNVIIKYKDLKVRSELEVEQIRKQLRKEAGLDMER